jgi:hypothetical protein
MQQNAPPFKAGSFTSLYADLDKGQYLDFFDSIAINDKSTHPLKTFQYFL